jgi:hypothetical protein
MNSVNDLRDGLFLSQIDDGVVMVRHHAIGMQVEFVLSSIVLQLINENLCMSMILKPRFTFIRDRCYEIDLD